MAVVCRSRRCSSPRSPLSSSSSRQRRRPSPCRGSPASTRLTMRFLSSLFFQCSQVGHSAGFKKASQLLLSSINFSVDPCEDFFEFSCGRWLADHPIPADLTSYGHFSEVREKVQEEMKSEFFSLPLQSQFSSRIRRRRPRRQSTISSSSTPLAWTRRR